jgi:fructose-bisphosphate aldolase class II
MKNYILKDALEKGYAVGAFNFGTLEILKSIIKASEESSSPVICQVSEGAINFIGEEYLKGIIESAKKSCKVPVSFHLDHGKSLDSVKKAIEVGCDSVMIDASMLPYEDNVTITKNVVEYAHSKNVFVEAELGSLAGVEDDINVAEKDSCYTDPKQAKDFVERTGIDSLAVAIGTKHGAYKFGGDAKLRFDILENIQKEIPNTPLVLHGASGVNSNTVDKLLELGVNIKGAKGVTDEILETASKMHICKVNCDTDIRMSYLQGILQNVQSNNQNIDYRKYLTEAMQEVTELVKQKIEVFGSNNKI